MSKQSTALISVLLVVIGIQGWFLYQTKNTAKPTSEAPTATIAAQRSDAAIAPTDVSNQLARIGARLSALETAKPTNAMKPGQTIILGSPEALASDRKILALLPDDAMTQQELLLFQSQLAQYPPDEQVQLSAALARAINRGQVQVGTKQ